MRYACFVLCIMLFMVCLRSRRAVRSIIDGGPTRVYVMFLGKFADIEKRASKASIIAAAINASTDCSTAP